MEEQAAAQRTAAIRDAAIVGGAILLALLLVILVARSLVRPLRRLRDSALKVAHDDLAREIEQVRAGGDPGPVEPIPVHTSEEVGQVAHAVDELHEQAVLLAGEQSRLQLQVSDMFETLSRRSRSLVDQQLSLIDRLERNEEDPERLESLFRLDHLAARMRRNGANLLVLAGAKVPREQAEPVPVSAVINAAASEVEDYTRVVTATVPDSEVAGAVAGDLVHLLAELLDNALRYSPPISQVRVSAVHTGNGGLVIEVSDIGLGMTDSDLRVANTRLQSGGEVNPYTARHMGLFVVGRLAAQHGSGGPVAQHHRRRTELGHHGRGVRAQRTPRRSRCARPVRRARVRVARRCARGHRDGPGARRGPRRQLRRRARRVLRRRVPQRPFRRAGRVVAATRSRRQRDIRYPGIVGASAAAQPDQSEDDWPEDEWPEDSMPAQTPEPVHELADDDEPGAPTPAERPADTSAFFAARAQAADDGVGARAFEPQEPQDRTPRQSRRRTAATRTRTRAPCVADPSGADDAIYQKMLSEWLVDPSDLANSEDLNWESVWDSGWSAAAAAEEAPVQQHTEEGLPMREPGARLVPGAAESAGSGGGHHSNGGAHQDTDGDDEVASAAEFGSAEPDASSAGGAPSPSKPGAHPQRDPDAVRASISSHFGGVHAGRSHARETRGTR